MGNNPSHKASSKNASGSLLSANTGYKKDNTSLSSALLNKGSKEDNPIYLKPLRILLLGCGDAGKTTLAIRWRLMSQTNSKKASNAKERSLIASTIRRHFLTVLDESSNQELLDARTIFLAAKKGFSLVPFSAAALTQINQVWDNPDFQSILRTKFRLSDVEVSLDYFLSQQDRLQKKKCSLTDLDILHCRLRSTGVDVSDYTLQKQKIQLIDMAGQRSERRKWRPSFRSCDLIVFLCALSGFDETLFEDGVTNRLEESLNTFRSLSEEPDLYETKIIILFSKVDLFEKKLEAIAQAGQPLREHFPESFSGALEEGMTPAQVQEVITDKFREKAGSNLADCLSANLLIPENAELFTDVYRILGENEIH